MIIGGGVKMFRIKPQESIIKAIQILFYSNLIISIYFVLVGAEFLIALLYLIIILVCLSCVYCSFCRILSFDETGCTIKCWKYQRKYLWKELKYIRYYKIVPKSKVPSRNRVEVPNGHGIEFSTKSIKRITKPSNYIQSWPFRFTYFFVTFPHKPSAYKKDYLYSKERGRLYYHVEDQLGFIDQLKKWGVEVDIKDMYVATWDK